MRQLLAILAVMFTALQLRAAQPFAPAPETTIRGVVTAVAGNKITLLKGLTIDVGGAKVTKQNAPAPDALVPGARVRVVVGGSKASGALVASSVIVESPDATIIGALDAVTPASVTIGGQSFAVNSATTYGGFGGGTAVAGPADLKAGMGVALDITVTPSGLAASRILAIGPPPPPPPVPQASQTTLIGAVTSIDKNAWIVAGKKVYLSPKTTIAGSPVVGDTVQVSGVPTPEGAVIAAAITKQ